MRVEDSSVSSWTPGELKGKSRNPRHAMMLSTDLEHSMKVSERTNGVVLERMFSATSNQNRLKSDGERVLSKWLCLSPYSNAAPACLYFSIFIFLLFLSTEIFPVDNPLPGVAIAPDILEDLVALFIKGIPTASLIGALLDSIKS